MSVFVGLDCGGSSSRVMAVDAAGKVLYQGHSGAANLVSTPDARLRRHLANAARGCPPATHACGCFAGLIGEEQRLRALEVLRSVFPDAQLRAEPDYTAAFYASPPGTDICLIAGTGSLVCSRGANGLEKSGGRGYVLGDDGSAFQYGRDAVLHFLRQPAEVSETLREAILQHLGSLDEGDVVAAVYRGGAPATVLAKIGRVVGQDAQSGEEYALASVEKNCGSLAQVVANHISRFLPNHLRIQISLAGGVWKTATIFQTVLTRHLIALLPHTEFEIARIARPPLHGAVELAKEMYGKE